MTEERGATVAAASRDAHGGSVETASVASADERDDSASRDAASDVAQTKLIVNYLPQAMTQDEVRALFTSVGALDSCKLVRDRSSGQSLGYAFVNYLRAEDARRAIASLNGLRLQNKTIKVSLARPSNDTIKGANLYVSGLPKSVTQIELEDVFRPYGHIITSKILCDTNTGLSRGVGFVRFDRRDEAERAIAEMSGTAPFAGCVETIQVKFANNPAAAVQKAISIQMAQAAATAAAAQTLMPTVSPMLQSPVAAAAASAFSAAQAAALNAINAHGKLAGNGAVNCTPAAGGPIHHTPQISKFRYSPLAGAPMISSAVNGTPLVNSIMSTQQAAAASGLQGADLNALLQMGATFAPQASNAIGLVGHQTQSQASLIFPQQYASTANNVSTAGLPSVGSVGGLSVFVYNLEPDTDDSVLWRLFGPFGAVQSVQLVRDAATNACKGYAFVSMRNADEALTATNALNGTQLAGRTLHVSIKT